MWIRSVVLVFMIGCVAGVEPADEPVATVAQNSVAFHCLNDTSIHVVTCEGSISLFPITVTIEKADILSNNEFTVLTIGLDGIAVLDMEVLDVNQVLDDVEDGVLDTFVESFQILVARTEIAVCTVVADAQVCK